jgi:hypothetical protein
MGCVRPASRPIWFCQQNRHGTCALLDPQLTSCSLIVRFEDDVNFIPIQSCSAVLN